MPGQFGALRLGAGDADDTARSLRGVFPQTGCWPLLLLDYIAAGLPAPGLPAMPDMNAALAQGRNPEDLAAGGQAVTLAAGLALDDAPYCGYFGGRPTGDASNSCPAEASRARRTAPASRVRRCA